MMHLLAFWALLIGACGYALWRGGAPERIVGASLLAAAAASVVTLTELRSRFFELEVGVLVVDVVLLAVLVAVALRADRFWPLVLAGFQLNTVGAHLFKLFHVDMIRITYALMIAIWSYPMLVTLAVGTWRHRLRVEAQGYDLAWSAQPKGWSGSTQ
jgi:hypothetical protein